MMVRRHVGWLSIMNCRRNARANAPRGTSRSRAARRTACSRHVEIGRQIEQAVAECARRAAQRSISAVPRPRPCQRSSTESWSSQAVPPGNLHQREAHDSASGEVATHSMPSRRPCSSEAMHARRHIDHRPQPDARITLGRRRFRSAATARFRWRRAGGSWPDVYAAADATESASRPAQSRREAPSPCRSGVRASARSSAIGCSCASV